MKKFKVVSQNSYRHGKEIKLSNEGIVKILGNDKNVVELFKRGIFTTAIDRGVVGPEYALGLKVEYDFNFAEIWDFIRDVNVLNGEGVHSMYICEQVDGSISFCAECEKDEYEFKAIKGNKDDIKYFEINSKKYYDYEDEALLLKEILLYCQSVFPVPVHSIKYIPSCVARNRIVGLLSSEYYIGLYSCGNLPSMHLELYRDFDKSIDKEYNIIIFEKFKAR